MNYEYGNQYQTTTTYNAQGGATSGGFLNQYGSQGGSQESPGASKARNRFQPQSRDDSYGKDTMRPVTIRQLAEAQQPHPDADFRIDGTEITHVTIIGQIRNISRQTTYMTYKIDDGTAIIEVKVWVNPDAAPTTETSNAAKPDMVEGSYVRVWGRLKAFNNRRLVDSHVIRPIQDHNEIQYHLLEAAVVHCYFTRGPPEQLAANTGDGMQDQGAYGQQMQGGDPNGAPAPAGKSLPPMSANARRVFNALRANPHNNEGLHVQNIASQLGMQIVDAHKAGDELLGLGLIFTTVDDETWALLEYV
ncbi:MAG: replication factor A protein 2 [Caeruleum heppii]|nr:MAG: replication factor A protein 2 [Caeruleum heppii]